MTVKDFPLGVGSQWVYLHTDSIWRYQELQAVVETVTVTIIGFARETEGQAVGLWIREFRTNLDTQYVSLEGDTVRFAERYRVYTDSSESSYEQELTRFVFPLKTGNTWKGSYFRDTFSVAREDSIEIPKIGFKLGFLVKRGVWIPNTGRDTDYWVVPGIGIVSIKEHYFTTGRENRFETWKLISYEIKN